MRGFYNRVHQRNWYIKHKALPEFLEYCYLHGRGEFSLRTDEAFERHLQRIIQYIKKGFRDVEPMWYTYA